MTNLIIMGVVVLVGFLSRNWWAGKIGKFVKNRREKKRSHNTLEHLPETSALFSPAGTKRTFVIALDIEELGNGEINISLGKLKRDKEKE